MQASNSTAEIAAVFKALADPNRLAILQLLRECCGESCRFEPGEEGETVSEIARRFDLALSTVSHHLKELRNAGLIDCVKRGQWVYCTPNRDVLARLRTFLEG
ncbi:MAG: metalloregulator ArsR/SmtB family transcription factor [Thermoanaerobaculia bacterium]|nr:metalloregulator ArsR/SmtB family transcription factor [Thermoanaerobaculia bacterium]